MNLFQFIDAEKANHPVRMMCRLLKVSPSGFYDWQDRGPSTRALANTALIETIRKIHKNSKKAAGSPSVHAELVLGHGMAVGKKRVAALMKAADLVGVHRRKRRCLTKQDKKAPPAPDLIRRDFTAVMPGIKMVGDIKCRRRHLMSYADLRTMPTSAPWAQVMRGSEVRKVGIVA